MDDPADTPADEPADAPDDEPADELPELHYGEHGHRPNWQAPLLPRELVDDDDELPVTPAETVDLLGFDPKEFSDE